MNESSARTLAVLLGGLALFGLVLLMRPDYLANPEALATVTVAQIVVASICRYRQSFFVVLMLAFLWAGMNLPMSTVWLQGRWIVLAIGALAGAAIYMKDPDHRFSTIHLVALFCVLSAVVSASVSGYPQEALLKSVSLFLLFLYTATGARLALPQIEPEKFFRKLLLACEVAIYLTSIAYFVFHWAIFGNPNSLGAVAGVVLLPVTFWGFLSTDSTLAKRRLGFELCLAMLLLVSTFSRSGIVAGAISCLVIAVSVRQFRLLVSGIALSVAISIFVVMFVPRPTEDLGQAQSQSIAELFLYKGKPQGGVFGSRKGPWDQTLAVIKGHPWFGSGFGTSVTGQSAMDFELRRDRFVDSRMIREHGNSYLAIMEWSGLLGVFPFYFLVCVCAMQARKALVQLRRTGNILSPAVPAAGIILAGLIGAAFEDWLFAVGYYLSVFFWAIAFMLADLIQSPSPSYFCDERNTSFIADPQFATSVVGQ